MSRVGKKPIDIPEGIDVKIADNMVKISKDDNVLEQYVNPALSLKYDEKEKQIVLKRTNESKVQRSLHGLYRSLINNMVIGLTTGFSKKLEIVGVGYRAEMRGKNLLLSLGLSHPVLFKPPENIEIKIDEQSKVLITGFDKQLVGQVAAKIRSFRPPEPYKGKGIKYEGEYIKRKAGKTAA